MVRFGVLGPVEAATSAGPVPLQGARQRAVLARLVVARGRVVPVGVLVDDLWPEHPPRGAVAAIRTFVADLRRAIEPDRAARRPATVLVTEPPGYALRAADVDAWRFEATVDAARDLAPADAVRRLDEALRWWRGPAYAEFEASPWARAEIDRLDELRALAVERHAAALLALDRPADAAAELQAHTTAHPLREDAWQSLALALYRSGRQGDALAALRRARTVLADELGIDPGPGLRALETGILTQSPSLAGAAPVPASGPAPLSAPGSSLWGPSWSPSRAPDLVGRDVELDRLRRAAADAVSAGQPVLALVSGEPGAGKTALVSALARDLAAAGWTVSWGHAPEHDGAQAVHPEVLRPATATPIADPAAGHLRRRRAAVEALSAAARTATVLLIADDLHRADEGTLDVLTGLFSERDPVRGPVLLAGTFRATEIGPALTAALARFARAEPLRILLGGLSEPATAALARAVAGRDLDTAAVHRRTGGNPFFVRELARLVKDEGAGALQEVPAGVRDVLRHRLAQLPPPAQAALRLAAVLGRDVDPDVLAALLPDPSVLDPAVDAGFLTDGGLRFTHVLIRDTVYGDLSALRRRAWHADAGLALARIHPSDVESLAHHFGHAGPAHAAAAARYAEAAAARAERRGDPHEAARFWRLAGTTPAVLMGLSRALAVTGHLAESRRLRAAVAPDPAALTTFDVPAVWPRNDDEHLSQQLVTAATRALRTPLDDAHRGRLLSTLALELRGTTTHQGLLAAIAAERIARTTGDPLQLAVALNARYMHTFHRTGLAPARAAIGAELTDLAARHDLVTFEVLGHLIQLQSAAALGDLPRADRHASAAGALATRYDLPLVGVFTALYTALRQPSEPAYRTAHDALSRADMPGMADGLLSLSLLSLGSYPSTDWGPYEPWVRPLLLLRADHPAEALAALRALPPSPHDALLEARLCLAARAAVALDDRPTMRALRAALLPAAAEHAGAQSGVLTFGPVAGYLDALA
ncbi:BTAD domain-containing putative transcriptional regulator [Dactylosporangium cerinum]|uniref:BTAD domain-containing putative transcriptional regulator n=1 Tax=Dactylosporangium cerinum TaxID=1434730 RepID=A0ABV9W2Z9_9ACTN